MSYFVKVLYKHLDITVLDTEQRIWITQCSDHPLSIKKNNTVEKLKSGIHIFFPDLACDRRKLIEIRSDALPMCQYFEGATNAFEEIYDVAVYRGCGLLLYGSQKPGRSPYLITRSYVITEECKDAGEQSLEIVRSCLDELPPPYNILKRTCLRTDQHDPRIPANRIPIKLPLNPENSTTTPNWDPQFGSFAV